MKRKRIVIASLLVVSVCIILSIYKIYTKPYKIPEISQVSYDDLGVDFSEEKSFSQLIEKEKKQKKKETSLKKSLNESNHPYLMAIISELPKEEQIEYLKEAIKVSPNNHVLLNKLRMTMLKQKRTEEYINFLQEITPSNDIKLHLALSYVDLLQDHDLGTAALGQRSTQSIMILNEILEDNPNNLLARYARGVNNLYWPSGLKRTEKAIQDLAFCVAIAEKFSDKKFPMFENFYITYGDALVKEGEIAEGRAVWERGYDRFPNNKDLELRAKTKKDRALKVVEKVRGIDIFQRPEDSITDLNVLWIN
ncbi:hypothetical protein [Bacillus sp. 166amftsu]|uniref:tetratricopeptide repeat protein n=1 Tax=Bacillus sp. 166amftsu TaxID=1761753 RepID=UPI00089CF2CC|nr:hypothetical protein [Bacillus sp. 166amftsu]SDZ40572.1 hypothetical protein SAMN04488156_12825 [Bacillus sp. 166amftsu]